MVTNSSFKKVCPFASTTIRLILGFSCLRRRRFARRQRHFQIVHHLRRGDDENDQQHKHQVQQRRDVQLAERTVMAVRGFFHKITGGRVRFPPARRSARRCAAGNWWAADGPCCVTAATARRTESSQRGLPGAFLPDRIAEFARRGPPTLAPRRRNCRRACSPAGSISSARRIRAHPLYSCTGSELLIDRPCRLRRQRTATRPPAARRSAGATAGGAAASLGGSTLGAATTLGVSTLGGSTFGFSGGLGFSGGFSFTISTEIFCICLPSNPCARGEIEQPPARSSRER